jgi:hypothetical protein
MQRGFVNFGQAIIVLPCITVLLQYLGQFSAGGSSWDVSQVSLAGPRWMSIDNTEASPVGPSYNAPVSVRSDMD